MSLDVIVVPETHWDREWFLPFERFRARLIDVVDSVLDLLERDPDYTFTLDGQTIVLEDYLTIRPERRADLERHVRSGRLAIGPWHVLPDEFLVSGEALVRNLLEGRRVGEAFGGVMRVGYTPDPFGHVAQLPQVMRGLGIDSFIFSRGIGDELDEVRDLFTWAAPDGSAVTAHHQLLGYGPAAALPRDETAALASLRAIRDRLAERARVPALLVGNGSDHSRPQAHVPALLRRASGESGDRYRLGRFEDYFTLAREHAPELPRVAGELRGARLAPVLAGVASARRYVKAANNAAQHALERVAEPAAALATHLGADTRALRPLLRHAWRTLLENHPHDSICGCSVDEVHDEMMPRFARASQVAAEVTDRAISLASETLAPLDGTPLILLNPEAWPTGGVVDLDLLVTSGEADAGLSLRDPQGQPVPLEVTGRHTQLVGILEGDPTAAAQWFEQLADRHPVRDLDFRRDGSTLHVLAEEGPARAPMSQLLERAAAASRADGVERVRIAIQRTSLQATVSLPEVEGLAYRVLGLRTGSAPAPQGLVRADDRLLASDRLELTVRDDGLLDVRHADGRAWQGLHRLEDIADAGDEYTHQALGEAPLTARLVRSEVASAGSLRASLRLTYEMHLPARLADDRQSRHASTIAHTVETTVSLAAGDEGLDFVTRFVNAAEDHRLQVSFPGERSRTVRAGSAFHLTERPVDAPAADGWSERPADAHPFNDVVALPSFALASRDTNEYSARHTNGGTELALTLLRSVGFLARGDLSVRPGLAGPPYPTPGGQCLGEQVVRYRWQPLASQDPQAVLAAAHRQPLAFQGHAASGRAPRSGRLLEVPAGWWCTALKPAEDGDGIVARLVRVSPDAATPPAGAILELDEQQSRQDSGTPWTILTVKP